MTNSTIEMLCKPSRDPNVWIQTIAILQKLKTADPQQNNKHTNWDSSNSFATYSCLTIWHVCCLTPLMQLICCLTCSMQLVCCLTHLMWNLFATWLIWCKTHLHLMQDSFATLMTASKQCGQNYSYYLYVHKKFKESTKLISKNNITNNFLNNIVSFQQCK